MQKLSCPDFLLCVAAEYAAQPTNHFTFISILPLMWYSLLERQVKPCLVPEEEREAQLRPLETSPYALQRYLANTKETSEKAVRMWLV